MTYFWCWVGGSGVQVDVRFIAVDCLGSSKCGVLAGSKSNSQTSVGLFLEYNGR